MNFSEDFLHYVWQFKRFDFSDLQTHEGMPIQVINSGILNKNAGPDFGNAKIQIGETLWAGNVEIHIKSSDWLKHNHQSDASFENVILHVVYQHDKDINRADGSTISVLELKDRIPNDLIDKYETLFLTLADFPCQAQIKTVDKMLIDSFLSRILVERFEQKTTTVFETLAALNGNWDETFYRFLAKNFGFKVNALPFELLAKAIPQKILAKHKNDDLQIEALVFGASGFLNDKLQEEYPQKLLKEFKFLQKKYNVKPIDVSIWKFMRMRPQNFPTLRLAQFAGLIIKSNHLFSKILEVKDIHILRNLFENLPINEYWKTHYHFKKEASEMGMQIGKASVDNILLNTIALFLFAYGKHTANQIYINRAIQLLESLPAEQNAITDKFLEAGIKMDHAFASQGILQLKKQYCDYKKCLSCGIGIKILR
ncbi:DUF2851 domain-containing protein [Pedobacter yonginense]|uniref:DUF2851 domain-containing protein n=1 Tax=Pedobacter yonginense TaxID=651869 RepID=A0A317ETI5_9SPHI|nr:DUF2851 family protein [Pedobacter yonginense]PWS28556.1 DUF2851 domain-containing protein [Pedobacter yonginense]